MSGRTALYPLTRQQMVTSAFHWTALNVKILLMANTYIPDFTNVHLGDVDAASIIATSPSITGLAATDGICDGDTTDFGVLVDPRVAGSLIFYNDTGTPSTSNLIVFFDTPDLPGMPQVLQGFDYFVYKNISFGGWFRP